MSKDLKVEVIGSGGAFDTELINSSFYVTCDGIGILFDCGYNVFPYLKEHRPEILEEMHFVVITHLGDDHVGSLKSLLYYRYFVLGKTTIVRYAKGFSAEVASFLPKNEKVINGGYGPAPIYSMNQIVEFKALGDTKPDNFLVAIEGIHHVKSFGFAVGSTNGAMVVISGDTKANKAFETTVEQIEKHFNIQESYILHDFSYLNQPGIDPHASITDIEAAIEADIEATYSPAFIDRLNYYHNNRNSLMGTVYEYGQDRQRDLDIGLKVEYMDYNHTGKGYEDIIRYLDINELTYWVFTATDAKTRLPLIRNGNLPVTEIVISNEEGEEDVFYKMCNDFNVAGKVDGLDRLIIYIE